MICCGWIRCRVVAVVVGGLMVLPAVQAQAPAGPHLLLGVEDFARLNEMAKTQPWAGEERAHLLKEADAWPGWYEKEFGLTSVELPPEGGSWAHLYECPGSGTRLVFHPPNETICPDTGKRLTGFPYDQHVYDQQANSLATAVLRLGLAYRLTGKAVYAEEAAEILTKYAAKYLSYPLLDNKGKPNPKGARVFSQTLDESIWLIKVAWAYDLVRDSAALTPASRDDIETKLLRPAAYTCGHAQASTYNIQSWNDAAVAAVGYTLGDKSLIAQAVDGPLGFRAQMENRVVDGFWIEGSWGYQFYALAALERTAQMAKRAGMDLWVEEPHLVALLESPVGVMFPDGSLPAFNDTTEDNVFSYKALYETAYSETKNPLFAAIAGAGGRGKLHDTKSGNGASADETLQEEFLFGVPSIPSAAMPALKSQVFPVAGYGAMRAPHGDLTEIMKFGPHGGGHGHFDELNEVNFADGEAMSVDPGTQLYGAPTHASWDKMTVAHNTMVVDEATQKEATGKLLAWAALPGATIASADAGEVYAQAALQRTVVLTSEYVLEISDAESKDGAEHDFDWCYHNFGKEFVPAGMKPYDGFKAGNGYEHLLPATTETMSGDVRVAFKLDDGKGMSVRLMGVDATQVFAGYGLGPNLKVKVPYVIARRRGKLAEFVAVMQPASEAVVVMSVTKTASGYVVHSAKWDDVVTLGSKPGYKRTMLP